MLFLHREPHRYLTLEKCIDGCCRWQGLPGPGNRCFGCAFCTIDGNDYLAMREKPQLVVRMKINLRWVL